MAKTLVKSKGEFSQEAYLLLGHIAMKQERGKKAIKYWRKALQRGENRAIQNFIGKYYFQQKQYKRASNI